MMDAVNDPKVESVVIMSAAQVGKTEIINNIIGYFIHQDPSPILLLQPTLQMGEAWSKDRLMPMARDSKVFGDLISTDKKRDGGNTILHKSFPGGHITIAGANSPASLASRPIRIVMMDEVDRYPLSAGEEGDPVNLARKRTTTFWNRKIVMVSTPTIKGQSRISAAYESSDKRQYHVPCPQCGHMQVLAWKGVSWPEKQPEKAHYICLENGCIITDADKPKMLQDGKWLATAPFSGAAGFHLNELYSPWVSFAEIACNFLEAKKMPETLKTFTNTALAETWDADQEGEGVEQHILQQRCEKYRYAPYGVLFLTCGVDVQNDRIEGEILGWGKQYESWSVDYFVIHGNPALPEIWNRLQEKLEAVVLHQSGLPMKIFTTCIDSGGHYTDEVYRFCTRVRGGLRVFAVKGASQMGKILVSKPTNNNRFRVKLYMVATDTAKELIYSRLKIEKPGPGYCHFPMHYDDEFFKQLTSEKFMQVFEKGRTRHLWKKTRPRNEALDCRVYNLAAYAISPVNLSLAETNLNKRIEVFKEEQARKIAVEKMVTEQKKIMEQRETTAIPAKPKLKKIPFDELLRKALKKGVITQMQFDRDMKEYLEGEKL